MAATYTMCFTNDEGQMIRWLVTQCTDDHDAVLTASAKMLTPYAALEISRGEEVIWRGSRDRANVWACRGLVEESR
jgi:hypothetical protein